MTRISCRAFAAPVLVVLIAVAVTGCSSGATPGTSSGGSTNGGSQTVIEKNFAFSPNALTVAVGDTVTFKNQDSTPHEVRIDNQDLGKQSTGQDVTWKAVKAGTFSFSCIIHPSMTGRITCGGSSGGNGNNGGNGGGNGNGMMPRGGTGNGGNSPTSTGTPGGY